MMVPPKVSIVIPVYNAEKFLQACLNSAMQQSLQEIEIICVDDLSTDTSFDILSICSENDERVKIIKHNKNKGEGAARNTGIENAKGDYIFHLDADDTIPLNAIETLYTEAQNNDSDMVKGRYDLIHDNERIQQQLWTAPEHKVVNTNIDESEFLQQIPTSHCTYLYKRSFLNQYNIRYRTDLLVGLDLIALAEALMHANSITLLPDLVYYYHQSESSATRGNISLNVAIDAIRSKKIVADMLKSRGMHDAASTRLQKWKFIIDSFFRYMPNSLTLEEGSQAFSCLRDLISEYELIPWTQSTPHQYRYLLALILAKKDEEALSFLSTTEAYEGFSNQDKLKDCLNFILEQVPGDIGAKTELGRIVRSEGKLEIALKIFDEIIQQNPKSYDAIFQATGTLIQLGNIKEARERLDTALHCLTKGLTLRQQINKAATLKEYLGREEIISKLDTARSELSITRSELKKVHDELSVVRDELNSVNGELDAVYSSTSWRVTKPLRAIMASIKRHI